MREQERHADIRLHLQQQRGRAKTRPNAARLPGKPGVRRDSAISQAEMMMKAGRRNSLGWMVNPGSEIQRCAPSTSMPCSKREAGQEEKQNPDAPAPPASPGAARAWTSPSITAPPSARKKICLIIAIVCGSVRCMEMPGVAASAST